MNSVTCLVIISMVIIFTNNIYAVPAQEYFFKIDSNLELDTININAHPVPKNATTVAPSNYNSSMSRLLASANVSATAEKEKTTIKPDDDEE